jgi:hypothetical protein
VGRRTTAADHGDGPGGAAAGVSGRHALALHALADEFAGPADRFGLLAGAFFRRFFVEFPALHFPERAFALHLLLERAQGLLDIIVADNDLNQRVLLFKSKTPRCSGGRPPERNASGSGYAPMSPLSGFSGASAFSKAVVRSLPGRHYAAWETGAILPYFGPAGR